jgi:hypothetical protein
MIPPVGSKLRQVTEAVHVGQPDSPPDAGKSCVGARGFEQFSKRLDD